SPLRRRMIEDMSIRQFGPKTQSDYVRVVREFAVFIGRSPDLADPEDRKRRSQATAWSDSALGQGRSSSMRL
ncbi:MAG: hypothetical protein ABI056_05015, partial [Caulobacteraceae bacterium]